jgi:hypothetical protein
MLMTHHGITVGITDPHYLIHHIHHITLITGDSGCTLVTFVSLGIKLRTAGVDHVQRGNTEKCGEQPGDGSG